MMFKVGMDAQRCSGAQVSFFLSETNMWSISEVIQAGQGVDCELGIPDGGCRIVVKRTCGCTAHRQVCIEQVI